VTNEPKKSNNLLNVKIEPLDENNINLLNAKTSVLSKTVNSVRKRKKKETINSEDDTLQIVSEALQSVKGLCESTDTKDDIAYNFCITTYSQLKSMSKKKQKIARSRISTIMLELESKSD